MSSKKFWELNCPIDNLAKKLPEQRTGSTRYSSICACQSLGGLYLPSRSSMYHKVASTVQVSRSWRLRSQNITSSCELDPCRVVVLSGFGLWRSNSAITCFLHSHAYPCFSVIQSNPQTDCRSPD